MEDFIKQLIKQLQENEKPFGLMSEEMQAKMRWLELNRTGEYIIEFYYNDGTWNPADTPQFNTNTETTYRLRADYTEPVEDEYELCEITVGTSNLFQGLLVYLVDRKLVDKEKLLSSAVTHPNFAGYLYEDGKVRSTPIIYKIGTTGWYEIEESKFSEYEILRPTHVVFKK